MESRGDVPAELRRLPRRPRDAHKGQFGRLLLVGGCEGMHGAPALAAAAAFRSGAGLVTVALPRTIYPITGALEARATYLPLASTASGGLSLAALPMLREAAAQADVVAAGPGLGTDPETAELVRSFVRHVATPLLLDADGLNAFAGEPTSIGGRRPITIVTPHPGEAARLSGQRVGPGEASRRTAAVDLAMRIGGTVILKGHQSVVTDGMQTFLNGSGNPGMATGGSGDVLTGCLAALLAVVPDGLTAARIAAWAHGKAGDLAAGKLGEIGVTATDLVECLPAALSDFVVP